MSTSASAADAAVSGSLMPTSSGSRSPVVTTQRYPARPTRSREPDPARAGSAVQTFGHLERVDRGPALPDRQGGRAQQVQLVVAVALDDHAAPVDAHGGTPHADRSAPSLDVGIRLVQS